MNSIRRVSRRQATATMVLLTAALIAARPLAAYRARLDRLTAAFGEDRVMFGSNWPETVGKASIPQSVSLMRGYFADKLKRQAEKYFWRNSLAIYKWRKRAASQPG